MILNLLRMQLGFVLLALIWEYDFPPFMVLIIAVLNDGNVPLMPFFFCPEWSPSFMIVWYPVSVLLKIDYLTEQLFLRFKVTSLGICIQWYIFCICN